MTIQTTFSAPIKRLASLILVVSACANAEQNTNKTVSTNAPAQNIVNTDDEWRTVAIENMVMLTLPQGKVVIELAPQFSPKHVEQFIQLTKAGHYNGTKFYRVIDGFVAQAGPVDGSKEDTAVPLLSLEGDWPTEQEFSFTLVQNNDLFAKQTGFKDGFALAHNPSEKRAWLTHCPGIIAMARGNEPDSGSSHFYITNGQAPRYLDRIMSIFGRVIYGMQHVQSITRTAVIDGETAVPASEHTPILAMQMMAELPAAQQIHLQVTNTESSLFSTKLADRIKRESAFFFKKPPPVLDVCQTPVLTRIIKH